MLIHPIVAGKFYPSNPSILRDEIEKMLKLAEAKSDLAQPKAIIAPHAGYIYSGEIAASAYACLKKAKHQIKRVVVLAQAHQYPFYGIATVSASGYLTPLGKIAIDQDLINKVRSHLVVLDEAFMAEHALEVQLPFLQMMLAEFSLVPLLVGHAYREQVANLLEDLWSGDDTLIVISSDLSHYHPYRQAQVIDKNSARSILAMDADILSGEDACGALAINGLLMVAKKKMMQAVEVDLRNSGDTSGSKDSVVGYGAFHFLERSNG